MRTSRTGSASADAAPAPAAAAAAARRTRIGGVGRRARAWLHDEALLVTLLVASFVGRWLLADRNSYWVDELYSVAVYGRWNDGAVAAIQNLAENSVHPPLYQFVLYHWMELFSDSEVATRSLSNLYVTLATLVLYLMLRDIFSRRMALASAVTFALMYLPLYYALETRSYAQTVLLATLSSYLLFRTVRTGHRADASGWGRSWRVWSVNSALFTLTNVALLLTHYYNLFFWAAQAVVAMAFVLVDSDRGERLRSGAVLVGGYVLQGVIAAAVWGRVLLDDFNRRSEDYAVDDRVQGVDDLLVDQVVTPNIDAPRPVWWLSLACVALVLVRALAGIARRGALTDARRRAWAVVYLVAWLVLPLVLVYTVFSLAGVERYNMRYFLYCVVPLAPLLVLTVDEAGRLAAAAWRRVRGGELPSGVTTAALILAILAFVIPGTHAAATEPKADWRGNVKRIVDVIRDDEENDYIVLEASHRRGSMANFYFERYSDDVRVHDVLAIDDERGGDGTHPVLRDDEDLIAGYDRLIVLFPHLVTGDFPNALEQLEADYDVHHPQLDRAGRGFIVYDIHPGASSY
ncbi:glycosyltransferase family 39 protein [Phytoactinopolyspora halotolerans]|uniref:Glycosyltransferase RgtA/B/C/D-like domain-containing protein n=1 Tax=Phytoactinopolyspora halotolerans TaxID=1981512 RepID=A0A6L9S860_9ACTN|nr:glycosyltransferase family 39 protein [Phytoactinopolyspora halotolerans]NEE01227.1 hypothetical protein [Phytoactinopolyspora halotolerans]